MPDESPRLAHPRYTYRRSADFGGDLEVTRVEIFEYNEQAQRTYFHVSNVWSKSEPGIGIEAEMQLEVQAALDEQQSAAIAERLADLRFRIADEMPS